VLAHYPFISVAALETPGAASAVTAGLAEPERITNVIREVFPAVLRPVSEAARALSDLQLGYALWGALAALLVAGGRRSGAAEWRALGVACLLLLILLLPMPGLTDWLWAHLPAQIKRITFYWPMHRFYLLLAALLATAGPAVLAGLAGRGARRPLAVAVLLAAGCGWSLWEARQFVRAGQERTASAEVTRRSQRPENRLLMNHAYGLFAALPAYFSNGVTAPWAESRLLVSPDGPALPPAAKDPGLAGRLRGEVDVNPGVLKLEPVLTLEPGKRYFLEFEFPPAREMRGILQLAGATLFREYVLPASGEARAFGSNPGNAPGLALWTTQAAPELVTLRFIPLAPGAKPNDFAAFAGYRLRELAPEKAPVQLTSLEPFVAIVRTPAPGTWLETPRMFLPGYTARIAGRPVEVRRSAAGLCTVPVPAGTSEVTLAYRAPLSLRLSYWSALLAWLALGLAVALARWRRAPPLTPS
jgi:hypothetical protein